MTRSALVLQHDPSIPLGAIEPVLVDRGYTLRIIDAVTADYAALDATAPDLLVILGGEMAAYETELHAFLLPQRSFVAARLEARRPILGVCLGAQVMAAAGGGSARRGERQDVGYRRVRLTEQGVVSPLRHFADARVLEWHGDTFDLPPGATLLASSEAYRNEAFAIGDWALAVQFHPEATDEIHERWVADGYNQLDELGLDADELRADQRRHGRAMTAALRLALGEWLDALP